MVARVNPTLEESLFRRSKVHLCNLGTATCLMSCMSRHECRVLAVMAEVLWSRDHSFIEGAWLSKTLLTLFLARCFWAKTHLYQCEGEEHIQKGREQQKAIKSLKKQSSPHLITPSVEFWMFWSGDACHQEVERSFDLQPGWEGADSVRIPCGSGASPETCDLRRLRRRWFACASPCWRTSWVAGSAQLRFAHGINGIPQKRLGFAWICDANHLPKPYFCGVHGFFWLKMTHNLRRLCHRIVLFDSVSSSSFLAPAVWLHTQATRAFVRILSRKEFWRHGTTWDV